jgi:hypothetical protein
VFLDKKAECVNDDPSAVHISGLPFELILHITVMEPLSAKHFDNIKVK